MKPSLNLKRSAFAAILPDAPDGKKGRRVKFATTSRSHKLKDKGDVPSSPSSRKHAQDSGDAKTCEYQSFKKLLRETCFNPRSYQQVDHHWQLHSASKSKKLNLTESDDIGCSSDSGLPISKSKTSGGKSCPLDRDLHRCGLEIASDHQNSMSLLPIKNVTPALSRLFLPTDMTSSESGHKSQHGGILSKKREKLLHLAAAAFSVQVNEFVSNRSELISELLQRVHCGRKSSEIGHLNYAWPSFQKNVLKNPVPRFSNSTYFAEEKDVTNNLLLDSCEGTDDLALPTVNITGLPFSSQLMTCQFTSSKSNDNFENSDAAIIAYTPTSYLENKILLDIYERYGGHTILPENEFVQQRSSASKWEMDFGITSFPSLSYESASAIEPRSDIQLIDYDCNPMDDLLTKLDFMDSDNYISHNFTSNALAELRQFNFSPSVTRQCSLPLLGWISEQIDSEENRITL